jgi:cell division septal protein FtsQ
MDGYKELINMRRKIKEDRERQIYAQARRRKEFVDAVATWSLVLLVLLVMGVVIWFTIHVIVNRGL